MSRRRWTYTMGGVPLPEPVEVSEDFQSHAERSGATIMCDRFMDGASTVDGVDIGSRNKRRQYKEAHGLADYGDFKNHWDSAQRQRQDRASRFSGDLRADLERNYEQLSKRNR